MHSVLRAKAQQPRLGAEHDGLDLRILVFQREIEMTGRVVGTKVGDLPFDPDIGIFAFKMGANGFHKVADHPHAAIRSLEGEPELIDKSHWLECTATARGKRIRRPE